MISLAPCDAPSSLVNSGRFGDILQLTAWYLFVTVRRVTADELKRKRERLGMTQAELAKRLGITKITVLRYENGQTDIPRVVELAMKEIERDLK